MHNIKQGLSFFILVLTLSILSTNFYAQVSNGIVPASVPTANKQGNGSQFQLSTGSTITGNCVKYDANGNTVDAGAICGAAVGTVTSVNTLTGTVALFTANAQIATYQALAADFSACKTIPVASGTFTITLVASGSQPPSGQCISIINYGAGVVTVARSGQNINGGITNLTIPAATATAPTGARVVSDGINYIASLFVAASGGGGATSLSGTYATFTGTAAGTAGNTFFCTNCPYQWRDNGTTWDAFIQGWGTVTVPPSTSWTWDTQGSSTVDFTNGLAYFHFTQITTFVRAYYRTAPATPYTLQTLTRHSWDGGMYATSSGNDGSGLAFRDSTGKLIVFRLGQNGSNVYTVNISKWTNATTFSADYVNFTNVIDTVVMQSGIGLGDDGTLLHFYLSIDGQHWIDVFSISRIDFFASGPNAIGMSGFMNGSSVDTALLSWKVF